LASVVVSLLRDFVFVDEKISFDETVMLNERCAFVAALLLIISCNDIRPKHCVCTSQLFADAFIFDSKYFPYYIDKKEGHRLYSQTLTPGIAEVVVLVDHNQANFGQTLGRHWFLQGDTYHQIESLVERRALARWDGNYTQADLLRSQIDSIPLILCCSSPNNTVEHVTEQMVSATTDLNQYPVLLSRMTKNTSLPNYAFRVAITDVPRSQGGGSTWSLICGIPIAIPDSYSDFDSASLFDTKDQFINPSTRGVLSWAHRALGISVALAEHGASRLPSAQDDLMYAVEQAKVQLLQWRFIHDQLYPMYDSDAFNLGTGMAMSLDKLFNLTSGEHATSFYHWYFVESRLSGRTAADAAFWFAMAGVTDKVLFELLLRVCQKELLRFGTRSSCRFKDVMDIVERLAAAGIRDQPDMEEILQRCLAEKAPKKAFNTDSLVDTSSPSEYLNLHSPHCSLLIWNFSTRQRKQRSFLQTAANHYKDQVVHTSSPQSVEFPIHSNDDGTDGDQSNRIQWSTLFDDPTRPLVVDIGCGMGISVLGLASLEVPPEQDQDDISGCYDAPFPWHACNFVGVDLSSLSIHYAQGIAQRWNIQGRVAFLVDEAELLLDQLPSYPGAVTRVLIQFPTPYRLPSSLDFDSYELSDTSLVAAKIQEPRRGNSQLPANVRNGGFMVTTTLLQKAKELLQRDVATNVGNGCELSPGDLILQSNCEDVAVFMRNIACDEAGFVVSTVSVGRHDAVRSTSTTSLQPTQRTLNWISMGGDRATGPGWWTRPILPPTGRTETEVACILHGTPVHRCVLRPSSDDGMNLW
jgi:SAM-dependent methyltransferase